MDRVVARHCAAAVGWVSIASGLGLVLAPSSMARLYGLPARPWLCRALGVRDVAIGMGLVASPRWRPWMLARGAGELCDGVLIGVAAIGGRPRLHRLTMAAGAWLLGAAEIALAGAGRRPGPRATAGPGGAPPR